MTTYNGRCHCGEITWKAVIAEENHILCHCNTCKQIGGGSFTINQIIPAADFKIEKGQVKKYTYKGDSGKEVYSYFCPTCTTKPYGESEAMLGKTVVIRSASLTKDEGANAAGSGAAASMLKPASEIYVKDRHEWQPKIAEMEFQSTPGADVSK